MRTEIKHKRVGKTLAKKGEFLFIFETDQVCLSILWVYIKKHLQASNTHHFIHYHTAREHREKSISLYPLREQVLKKGKENKNLPEENYLTMP